MGCFMIAFVICVECVGVKYTMLVGILIEFPFAIGELLLGLEAYYFREFFSLQLVRARLLVQRDQTLELKVAQFSLKLPKNVAKAVFILKERFLK